MLNIGDVITRIWYVTHAGGMETLYLVNGFYIPDNNIFSQLFTWTVVYQEDYVIEISTHIYGES